MYKLTDYQFQITLKKLGSTVCGQMSVAVLSCSGSLQANSHSLFAIIYQHSDVFQTDKHLTVLGKQET